MQLKEDVGAAFPQGGDEPEPRWDVFVLGVPGAPVTSISRDPRSGPRLAPVFFVGASDREILDSVARQAYEGTSGLAPLFHQVSWEGRPFLLIPLMLHMVDATSFSESMTKFLSESRFEGLAWFVEPCEVLITHEGRNFKAVPGADGSFQVISEVAA